MMLMRLIDRLIGHQTEREWLDEMTGWDMSRPVTRHADRDRYEMPEPGETRLEQMKRVRRAEVIR